MILLFQQPPSSFFEQIIPLLKDLGVGQGLFVVFICLAMYLLFKKLETGHEQALEAKQKEIDRLSAENKWYREMFVDFLKDKLHMRSSDKTKTE